MERIILMIVIITVASTSSFEIKEFLSKSLEGSANPDIYLSALQIIARHGYPSESYTIESKDGFLLTLHRIPHSKYSKKKERRQPVFLQHGLLGASTDWLIAGNKSLAFILSDIGYDVWLGNARGNTYSRGHVKYTPKDAEFWDFSFHEMGVLDLPAIFSFIEETTDQKGELIYVGHSMGTTMFFVYASTQKAVNETIKVMVPLAPVAFMSDIRSPIRYLAPWANDLEWLAKYLGINEFLPSNKILKYLAKVGCDADTRIMKLCEDIIFLICGFDRAEFNTDILPVILSHEPAGASTKTVIHYAQEIKSGGRFCEFDYGTKENIKRYGTDSPPSYNVTNINVPIYLISGLNDKLAGQKDVQKFANLLPERIGDYIVPMKSFNHVDFIYGKDAPTLVYKPLIKVIQKYRTN